MHCFFAIESAFAVPKYVKSSSSCSVYVRFSCFWTFLTNNAAMERVLSFQVFPPLEDFWDRNNLDFLFSVGVRGHNNCTTAEAISSTVSRFEQTHFIMIASWLYFHWNSVYSGLQSTSYFMLVAGYSVELRINNFKLKRRIHYSISIKKYRSLLLSKQPYRSNAAHSTFDKDEFRS